MKSLKTISFLVGVIALSASCGSDEPDRKSITPSQSQKQSAQQTVTSTQKLTEIKTNKEPGSVMNSLGGVYASSQQLLNEVMASKYQQGLTQRSPMSAADTSDCVTESDNVVSYNCNFEGQSIVGTITQTGEGSFRIDLKFDYEGYELKWAGWVGVTSTQIDGDLTYEFSMSGQGISGKTTVEYHAVTYAADGCPIGGEMLVYGNWSVSGQTIGADVRVLFGPTCGEMQMWAA